VWLDNDTTNLDWGEVTPWPKDRDSDVRRGLDNGANPGYPGQCLVGDPQWFLDGRLPPGIMDDPVPPVPQCCLPVTVTSSGGIVLGGTASVPVLNPCGFCAPGTQRGPGMTVTAVGGTGDYVAANGTYPLTLPQASFPCSWGTFDPTPSWQFTLFSATGNLFVQANWNRDLVSGAFWQLVTTAPIDCSVTRVLPFAGSGGLVGSPPTVTVGPT
jgi:hypothetical protein